MRRFWIGDFRRGTHRYFNPARTRATMGTVITTRLLGLDRHG
jgi:hypothetical protein